MSHLPNPRRCRHPLHVLILIALVLTCLYRYRLPASSINTPINEHLSTPIYEHVSPYRQNANQTQEELLEKQLIRIEESIKSAIVEQGKDTRAGKTIWQLTSSVEAPIWEDWTQQWRNTNPNWEVKQYTSSPGQDILPYFRSIPSISQTLSDHSELERDIFRWLILWYHGGFFIEPDVWPRVAIHDCFDLDSIQHPSLNLPRNFPDSTSRYVEQREKASPISLVLGIDIDEPYMAPHVRDNWGWSRSFSFATYTMWAPGRFDPLLRKAIVRCV